MDKRGLLDLCIARIPNISSLEKIRLCDSIDSEAALMEKSKDEIERIINRPLKTFWDVDIIRSLAERDAYMAQLRGINWVSWVSPAYPPQLREIYDPPALLFFRGRLPNPELPLAAVVGTRQPSPQAAAQAFEVAKDLGRCGISVVSGLALGTDAMAHRGNIEGGAATFAVLGSGVDEVYPSSNRNLAKRIIENGGALLSEYPPGMGPRKWNFPARNRIISGLSRAVLIVEAPRSSGALITAGFAAEQGREVFVASVGAADNPPAMYDRSGSAKLAVDGAAVISSAMDILKEWNIETGHRLDRHLTGVDS
ncbi:MAG: DNA-processing protein DprA, partial [Treponema sp.]|nr:DNA-processing protein DprA [Treponema sp.]